MTRYSLKVLSEAKQDLAEALDWYEARQSGLGRRFLAEISSCLERIRPMMYAKVRSETRRAVVNRFPFAVFYYIDANEVVVLAVLHMSRDPQRWMQRS
ncbi:type II toxin-antitoxin system RelE/ParE family toxin [Orrella sp. 11846]|uniref:type II toxin-antitoxin system RelE/ParE family toxin n=1 Tax=Orrella sp. 11846 TaxID=3409913 RepID=UPI003B5C0B9A